MLFFDVNSSLIQIINYSNIPENLHLFTNEISITTYTDRKWHEEGTETARFPPWNSENEVLTLYEYDNTFRTIKLFNNVLLLTFELWFSCNVNEVFFCSITVCCLRISLVRLMKAFELHLTKMAALLYLAYRRHIKKLSNSCSQKLSINALIFPGFSIVRCIYRLPTVDMMFA